VVTMRTAVVPNISSNSVILCKIKMHYLAIFLLVFNLCSFIFFYNKRDKLDHTLTFSNLVF